MKSKTILAAAMAALMILALAACEKEQTAEPTDKADYSGSVTDWVYAPESDDELIQLLVTIDSDSYGSAGASLQQANAAVSLMKLAAEGSEDVGEAVKAYLAGMNATQKDFFSFQWQQALKEANALLDGSKDAGVLEDAGDGDFDLQAVDSNRVAALDEAVTKLLRDAGVTDEWKNHTDLEPFNSTAD